MTYLTMQKSQLLDSIEHQALYADLCSVVIGEEGLGKSFLIEQLHSRLSYQVELACITAGEELSVSQLEVVISQQLKIQWKESDNLIARLKQRFDRRVLLTIDDAHLLPNTCLEYLMMLVAEQLAAKEVSIFILLAGDERLATKLSKTSTLINNPNICVVFELQPIELNECKHLVAHLQAIDEGTVEALYDEQKLNYLWQLSKGNPGLLNYQLNRWLAEKNKKAIIQNEPQSQMPHRIVGTFLYAIIAAVLASILYFQDDLFGSGDRQTESDAKHNMANSPSGKALMSSEGLVEKDTPRDSDASTEKDNSLQSAVVRKTESAQKVEELQKLADAQTTKDLQKEKVVDSKENIVEQTPIAKNATNEKSQPRLESPQTNPKDVDLQETLDAKQTHSNAVASYNKAEASHLSLDEQNLLQIASDRYMLQWVGVSQLEAAERFRADHPLKSQLLIYKRVKNDKPLYLIVSGQYLSRIDADNARQIYLQRGYPGTPWIKSISAIQSEIKNRL